MTLPYDLRAALVLSFALLLATAAALLAPASAPAQEDSAPVITFSSPADGSTVSEPAFVIHFCFAAPVSTEDLFDSDDFYIVTAPDGFRLGRLTEFQGNGYGVSIFANNADAEVTEGEWTVDYHITSADGTGITEGQLTYTVDPDGEELPQATPPRCLESGFTATPGPSPSDTEPPASSTEAPDGSETPAPTPAPGNDAGDDDSDTLLIVLAVVGALAGVALLGAIAFLLLLRRFRGRPPDPDADPPASA